MLVPGVEGDRKQRTRFPFEGDALAGVVPNRRRAEAGQYVDHFLEQLPLRRELRPCRYLAHIAVVRGSRGVVIEIDAGSSAPCPRLQRNGAQDPDRKSTRLNSSHTVISYAVFCLKKKKKKKQKKKPSRNKKTKVRNKQSETHRKLTRK